MSRRINITANHVIKEEDAMVKQECRQLDLFTDFMDKESHNEEDMQLNKEKQVLKTMIDIKKKYGKNAILKGMNFEDGGTTIERNEQVGGHKG